MVIVLAGLYVFVRPERGSPWSCLAGGIDPLSTSTLSFCVILPGFVLGSIVSAALLVYGGWLLSTSGATSSTTPHGVIAGATFALIVVSLSLSFLAGPLSPLHSSPTQTSAPATFVPPRSAPPTR